MATYLVTGAGRGIGLELIKQLTELDKDQVEKVFALSRGKTSQGLNDLMTANKGRVVAIFCEVTNEESIHAAVKDVQTKLEGRGLDVLVNNVGAQPIVPGGISAMNGAQLMKTFDTNVVSAHLVTAAFLDLLRAGKEKKIINISTTGHAGPCSTLVTDAAPSNSTTMGSMAFAHRYAFAPTPEYKITKTAMNMLSVQYALALEKEGFTVLAISPGWLKTDMGSSGADLEVEVGIKEVRRLILEANPSQNGKFLNIHVPGWENAKGPNRYDGAGVPW